MKIKMELLSDTIFGNGMSIPGGEDISVLSDENGFPYYKGSTFKGIFREELEQYLDWMLEDTQNEDKQTRIEMELKRLLGESGNVEIRNEGKLVFSDFQLADSVKKCVLEEVGKGKKNIILDSMSHIRTFNSISEDGVSKKGALRNGRCVNKGLCFYGEIQCDEKDAVMVTEVISNIKWLGSMRNRGFGKVKLTVLEGGN